MHGLGVRQLRRLHRWHGHRGVPAAPIIVHGCVGLAPVHHAVVVGTPAPLWLPEMLPKAEGCEVVV